MIRWSAWLLDCISDMAQRPRIASAVVVELHQCDEGLSAALDLVASAV